jgi:S-adenosylmethionine:tRNA ribosyltransferase-isomerase
MYNLEDYDYELPEEAIAQVPVTRRDSSRLLVLDRKEMSTLDGRFLDLPTLLRCGDLLVVNDTRVVPARLFGRKETGGRVEVLVLEHPGTEDQLLGTRTCLVKSSRRPKKGSLLFFEPDVSGKVQELLPEGLVRITFSGDRTVESLMREKGHMPLPPYIKRGGNSSHTQLDRERYQTVFSKKNGAIAAPTAGLHFTEDLIENLKLAGISIAPLTLHVGFGTFRPVRTKDIRKHRLSEEFYRIEPETAKAIERTKKLGGRVVAVGTTVVRALETAVRADGSVSPGEGKAELFVTPGFTFRVVDALITNFHLPKSSLLFLVSAFAGLEFIKHSYRLAIQRRYRFYSYGDAMLIL